MTLIFESFAISDSVLAVVFETLVETCFGLAMTQSVCNMWHVASRFFLHPENPARIRPSVMAQYRKRPEIIEAKLFIGENIRNDTFEIQGRWSTIGFPVYNGEDGTKRLLIADGVRQSIAEIGDYVCVDPTGKIFVCPPATFHVLYETID